ncbi:hypothetical protein [Rossellomorea aquimaris]|uniref:hypothetical protein n=1 Tax=Rossellomorea aquimaris TaxID=189382 RepID=UPI003CE6DC65
MSNFILLKFPVFQPILDMEIFVTTSFPSIYMAIKPSRNTLSISLSVVISTILNGYSEILQSPFPYLPRITMYHLLRIRM